MSESDKVKPDSSQESTEDGINSVLKKAREAGRGKGNYLLGNLALVAGTFDYLGFESMINDLVGKVGSRVADGRVSRPSGSHFPATQGRVLRPKVHHLDLSITTV